MGDEPIDISVESVAGELLGSCVVPGSYTCEELNQEILNQAPLPFGRQYKFIFEGKTLSPGDTLFEQGLVLKATLTAIPQRQKDPKAPPTPSGRSFLPPLSPSTGDDSRIVRSCIPPPLASVSSYDESRTSTGALSNNELPEVAALAPLDDDNKKLSAGESKTAIDAQHVELMQQVLQDGCQYMQNILQERLAGLSGSLSGSIQKPAAVTVDAKLVETLGKSHKPKKARGLGKKIKNAAAGITSNLKPLGSSVDVTNPAAGKDGGFAKKKEGAHAASSQAADKKDNETEIVLLDNEDEGMTKSLSQDFAMALRKSVLSTGRKSHHSMFVDEEPSEAPVKHRAVFADFIEMKKRLHEALSCEPYCVSMYYHETGIFQEIARSAIFDQVTLVVIGLNAIWIAIDSDMNRADLLIDAETPFIIIENIFCSYFFSEWFIRFMAFRYKLDCCRDFWFVFDSVLVFLMALETWVMTLIAAVITGGKGGVTIGSTGILKVFKLLRLSRMARMARLLRAMPELMILIRAILVAFRSVFFTLCLLMLIIYVFAIAMVQLTDDETEGCRRLLDVGSGRGLTTNSDVKCIKDKYFDGVFPAMANLLLAGNLPDHEIFVADVYKHNWFAGVILMIFICLAPLTVMGMLAGVLVEVVSVVSAVEKEAMIVDYVKEKLLTTLRACDHTLDGHLNRDEFADVICRRETVIMLQSVGVDVIGLAEFVDFLFCDQDTIAHAAFMELVLQLRGNNTATVKDIVDLRKYIRNDSLAIREVLDVISEDMEKSHISFRASIASEEQKLMEKIAGLETILVKSLNNKDLSESKESKLETVKQKKELQVPSSPRVRRISAPDEEKLVASDADFVEEKKKRKVKKKSTNPEGDKEEKEDNLTVPNDLEETRSPSKRSERGPPIDSLR